MPIRPFRGRQSIHLAISLLALGALVLLLRQLGVTNSTTVALSFLIVVLTTATASSLWVVIVCSVTAALALNYFFMPPVGTLSLADPEDLVALVVFLIVGFVSWELSTSAQARAREAQSERKEAENVRQKAELGSAILA
jgi:two-component system sensor histidine kinase KdpD